MLLTVPEAAGELKIGTTKLKELIAEGSIPVVRIGRSVRVNKERLAEWVRKQAE